MEKFNEREMSRQLRHFEQVWRRVGALRAPRETAERCGVPLMPRQASRSRYRQRPRRT